MRERNRIEEKNKGVAWREGRREGESERTKKERKRGVEVVEGERQVGRDGGKESGIGNYS